MTEYARRPRAIHAPTKASGADGRPAQIRSQRATNRTTALRSQPARDDPLAIAKDGRLTLTVEETANLIGIARTTAYECIRTGAIPAIRLGRRILVPAYYLDAMLRGTTPANANATDDPDLND